MGRKTMSKALKLRLCDWLLLPVTVLMLASSIQLEITAGSSALWVWVHIALGLIFFVLISWHLQLHFQWRNWLRLIWRQKKHAIKWLTVIGLLTLITAIASAAGWIISPEHSKIGAIHGKLGFLFIALAIGHIIHRWRFYRR